jgi:hypothetical protein
LKNVILIEGEVFWEIEWVKQSGKDLLEDSFERQSVVVEWNASKFNELKAAYT